MYLNFRLLFDFHHYTCAVKKNCTKYKKKEKKSPMNAARTLLSV